MPNAIHTSHRTLRDALAAAASAADNGITFINDQGTPELWTYQRLHERALAGAGALLASGLRRGDRVALILPDAVDFVPAFFAAMTAGGVGVPLAPPTNLTQLGRYLESAGQMVAAAGARYIVTTRAIKALIGTVPQSAPSVEHILTVADLEVGDTRPPLPALAGDDLALVQFTSGSTARPKGVMLSHANLVANCRAITEEGLRITDADRCVSWLPLFHDMGLIGFVICPMFTARPVTLMPPMMFVRRPGAWLRQLSQERGTVTYAPNFAYAYTTKRVRDAELEGLDLSTVRVAGCGAEPIHAETLRAFARRFGAVGFRESAFVPSYGMAESSLAIAFAQGLRADHVASHALSTECRATPALPNDRSVVEVVACGRPFAGHTVDIVDPHSGARRGEREVGEIRIGGPSVTRGYFQNDEATQALFDEHGRLRTGDLGYLADGEVYICGRIKDIIIVRGRNIAPHDLEWEAAKVEGVRSGGVAAFGVDAPSGESVVVVAEAKKDADHQAIMKQIGERLFAEFGVAVDDVIVVEPGTIPKTSSGKLQRAFMKEQFLQGMLVPPRPEGVPAAVGHLVASQVAHLKGRLGLKGKPA